MKKFLSLVVVIFFSIASIWAQRSDRSVMRIRLSDNSPLMVTINNRDFKKVGRTVTIGDIPRKRQSIQVYKFRPYADGNGGKAELVYSGTVKIQKGGTYDCVVDTRNRKFRMRQVRSLQPIAAAVNSGPRNTPAIQNKGPESEEAVFELPPDRSVPAHLQSLKKSMDKEDADSKKLSVAQQYVASNNVNTQEVQQIADWIFFDDNRLLFVKSAYAKVSDKQNFGRLAGIFTLDESKKDFDSFMRGK